MKFSTVRSFLIFRAHKDVANQTILLNENRLYFNMNKYFFFIHISIQGELQTNFKGW